MVIFAQIFPKQALKYTIFFNFQKRPKNGQMAKLFYFWQTVSKKAKLGWFGLFKGQMATLGRTVGAAKPNRGQFHQSIGAMRNKWVDAILLHQQNPNRL